MFIIGFFVGFVVCGLLTVEMLKRKGLMDDDGRIVDLKKESE